MTTSLFSSNSSSTSNSSGSSISSSSSKDSKETAEEINFPRSVNSEKELVMFVFEFGNKGAGSAQKISLLIKKQLRLDILCTENTLIITRDNNLGLILKCIFSPILDPHKKQSSIIEGLIEDLLKLPSSANDKVIKSKFQALR